MSLKLLSVFFCLVFTSFINAQEIKEAVFIKVEAKDLQKVEKNQAKDISEPAIPAKDELNKYNKNKQISVYQRPNSKERFKRYVNGTIGPFAILKNAASAGIGTARNSPEEWKGNIKGFGKRFASSMGQGAIKQTTIYGLDEALKLDSKFYRSNKKDFGSRFKNALLSTVTARNKEGKRVVGVPRIAGTYTSSIIAREAWYPKRFDYKDGLRSGSISLGTGVLFNMFKEFVLK